MYLKPILKNFHLHIIALTANMKNLLIGNITADVFNTIKTNKLEKNLDVLGYVSHPEMIKNIAKSDLLLLLIPNTKKNLSIVQGKIFEYLAAPKYIIGIRPKKGDSAKILTDAKAGEMFEFSDFEDLKSKILEHYKNWQIKKPQLLNEKALKNYTRKELTNKLTQLFNLI